MVISLDSSTLAWSRVAVDNDTINSLVNILTILHIHFRDAQQSCHPSILNIYNAFFQYCNRFDSHPLTHCSKNVHIFYVPPKKGHSSSYFESQKVPILSFENLGKNTPLKASTNLRTWWTLVAALLVIFGFLSVTCASKPSNEQPAASPPPLEETVAVEASDTRRV